MMNVTKVTILAVAVALTLSLVSVEAYKTRLCDLGGPKLPDHVIPNHYDLSIKPNIKGRTFEGQVDITVDVQDVAKSKARNPFRVMAVKLDELARKLKIDHKVAAEAKHENNSNPPEDSQLQRHIVLHADKSVDIQSVEYQELAHEHQATKREHNWKSIKVVEVCRDESNQLVSIKLDQDLVSKSTGQLKIKFLGKIRNDMRGIYISSYLKDDGQAEEMIVSQFQGTDIRFAIPTFDEPKYKASVSLRLIVDPKYTALASTKFKGLTIQSATKKSPELYLMSFDRSDRISLDLFAFAVGDFGYISGKTKSGVKVSAHGIAGTEKDLQFALDTAIKALEWMENYTGHQYPQAKFDLLAVPDHNKGNCENWGLVTVRDVLVRNDDETRRDLKITTAVNVVHIVAHQWFANMLTAEHWNELWVTEGVAAHLAYEMVRELYPDFPLDSLSRISILTSHVQKDTTGKYHALEPETVETSQQVYNLYDNFEFMKGGSLIEMLRNHIGKDKLRESLSKLVTENKFSTVTGKKLISAVESTTGIKVEDIVRSWTRQTSIPMVDVISNPKEPKSVLVSQQPYTESSNSVDQDNSQVRSFNIFWSVPTSVMFYNSQTGQSETVEFVIEAKNQATAVQAPEWFDASQPGNWLKVNPNADMSTFYRVRYSDPLMQLMQTPIENRLMCPADRLNLLDDATYLVQGAKMSEEQFQKLLSYYLNEDEGGVLIGLLIAYKVKSAQKVAFTPASSKNPFVENFKTFGFSSLENESIIQQRSRQLILKALIDQNVESAITAALKAYDDAKSNGKEVDIFLRVPVYTAIARHGSSQQIEELLSRLETIGSYDEQLRLANAIALANDASILNRLIDWMASKSNFKAEVALSVVSLMKASTAGTETIANKSSIIDVWQKAPKPEIPTN